MAEWEILVTQRPKKVLSLTSKRLWSLRMTKSTPPKLVKAEKQKNRKIKLLRKKKNRPKTRQRTKNRRRKFLSLMKKNNKVKIKPFLKWSQH